MFSSLKKNFAFNIMLRITIIIAATIVCTYVLLTKRMLFVPVVMVTLIVFLSINLLRYIRSTTKYLSYILSALKESAYSDSVAANKLTTETAGLGSILQEVSDEFARVSLERELQFQYLQTILENINVGIMVLEPDGTLQLANGFTKKMLEVSHLRNVEDLKHIDEKIYDAAATMTAGDKRVIRIHPGEKVMDLSIHLKEIVQRNKNLKIFLLQNISRELDDREVEAWQKLTQVLTHEIMNSVTPIASLSDAIQTIISENGSPVDLRLLDHDRLEDIHDSVATISSRSKGLMQFVSAYKEFAKNPELKPEFFDVIGLVQKITGLFAPDLEKNKIRLQYHFQKIAIETKADPVLIEQVLINLIKNAIDAVAHDGTGMITVQVKKDLKVQVSVSDNGRGIPAEIRDKIFIPFFTTRAKGSGVGLSLCKQIMKLHDGNIWVSSTPEEGSAFTIEW
jgi:two-component system, NtrC family, nitrogen regulation sensor histidine kinase NtrY